MVDSDEKKKKGTEREEKRKQKNINREKQKFGQINICLWMKLSLLQNTKKRGRISK